MSAKETERTYSTWVFKDAHKIPWYHWSGKAEEIHKLELNFHKCCPTPFWQNKLRAEVRLSTAKRSAFLMFQLSSSSWYSMLPPQVLVQKTKSNKLLQQFCLPLSTLLTLIFYSDYSCILFIIYPAWMYLGPSIFSSHPSSYHSSEGFERRSWRSFMSS